MALPLDSISYITNQRAAGGCLWWTATQSADEFCSVYSPNGHLGLRSGLGCTWAFITFLFGMVELGHAQICEIHTICH